MVCRRAGRENPQAISVFWKRLPPSLMLGYPQSIHAGVVMNAVAQALAPTLQGVICRNCGKPIRLSAKVIKRRTASNATETNQNPDFITQVFSARCRRCQKESLYTLAEIENISCELRGMSQERQQRLQNS